MLKAIRSKSHNLFIPLLFWLAGIVIATKINSPWSVNLLVVISLLVMIFVSKLRTYLLLLLFFLLGWIYTSSYLQPNPAKLSFYLTPAHSISEVFTYKVLDIKHTRQAKRYYVIEIDKLNDYSITGKVLLYNNPDSLKTGHLYQTPLSISSIDKPHNPAEFDFNKFYSYLGIEGQAKVIGISKLVGRADNIWLRMKTGIASKIEATFKENTAMALALFLGEKGLLGIDQDRLSEMGLIHLFAVSGLHVGIIYFLLNTLLKFSLKAYYRRLYSIIPLIFYGYLCDWTPSVFRTVLIIAIYNLTLSLQRKISFLQLLAITLFIITVSNPLQLFSVGLHLSLTAFIALWIADRKFLPPFFAFSKKYRLNKYIFKVGEYCIYSLTVIIVIAPLTAYYFNIISLNAFITNFLATPIVALMLNVIVLALFIPAKFMAISHLSEVFNLLNWLFGKLIAYSAYLPLFTRRITFTKGELIAVIVIVALSLTIFKKRKKWAFIIIPLASLLIILQVAGVFTNYQDQVICFAAGNADCSYLEFSDGKNLLIDTGSLEQYPNIIRTSLLPYLRKRHINSLDKVIITHPHEDHYGGLPLLAQNIKIKEIIIHQTALNDETFCKLLEDLKPKNKIIVLQDTTSLWQGRISILHPIANCNSPNMNNNSIVALVTYDNYKLLFTGDIEAEAEELLVDLYGAKLKADFLKVAHHGSISSSIEEFLNMVNPKKCFIPAGNKDRNKFPNPLVLERLKDRGVKIHIGADDGALIMKMGN